MLRARPDPKQRRPPVALRHGFTLQIWSASRQNFKEGGPRTFPGIASLKFVNRFENPWYLQRLQYVRKIVKQPGTEGAGRPIQRRSHRDRCGKSTIRSLNTQPYLPQHFLTKKFVHPVKARETRTR